MQLVLSVFIVAVLLTCNVSGGRNRNVVITIFDQANFAGTQQILEVRKKKCTNVPTILNDKISSISFASDNDIPACIYGFREFNCEGIRFDFNDGTTCLNDLSNPECNSDNTISSFIVCEKQDFRAARTVSRRA